MNLSNMPNCCGVTVITNFGHSPTNGADYSRTYKPTRDEVKSFLKNYCRNRKLYIAYLDENQRKAVGKALTDFGFIRKTSFKHPAHDSIVHEYQYIQKDLKLLAKDLKRYK